MHNGHADVCRKAHFDMHTPATVPGVGQGFEPGRFAGALAEAGSEAACTFTQCAYGWSCYSTRVEVRF